MADCTMNSINC